MSVFSKIFIVINLMLTLLLVAATATQINLKGIYKQNYRQTNKEVREVEEELGRTKSDYQRQVATLRKQASDRKDLLQKNLDKQNAAESRRKAKQSENTDLSGKKTKLKSEIDSLESQNKKKAAEIKSLRESLTAARAERERLWKRVQQLIHTWFDLDQELRDAREWEKNK